jgi:hypothetical protein
MKKLTFGTPEAFTPSKFCDGLTYTETEISYPTEEIEFYENARGCVLRLPLGESEHLYGLGLQLKAFDLRGEKIFTIDGPTAKDLDDAVSVRRLDNGNYLLGVHIADVSHFVAEDGPLDKEALKRGTSVYLLNRVVPMLPKTLSNGICSLNPDEDRLTLSCIMEIDGAGEVVNHTIEESVIRSCARMVYDDVSDIIENDDPVLKEQYRDIYEDIMLMGELASILGHRRKQLGSLDFDSLAIGLHRISLLCDRLRFFGSKFSCMSYIKILYCSDPAKSFDLAFYVCFAESCSDVYRLVSSFYLELSAVYESMDP